MAARPIHDERQRGYALMGVIWLLLFAGSVTGLLLMRASDRMVEVRKEGEMVKGRLALEGAPDAIAAERLFGRADSSWMTAGSHSIDLDGITVMGTISSEEQRLDVNRATAKAIDIELEAAGISRETRIRTLGNIATIRSSEGRVGSLTALGHILKQAQQETTTCLLDRLTVFGGRGQPLAPGQNIAPSLPVYALVRVVLSAPAGGVATVIMRNIPVGSVPVLVLNWRVGSPCGL